MSRIHFALSAAAITAGSFVFSLASCSQPAIQCVVGHGPFAAKYELIEGTGSCAALLGEEIGLATFLAPNSDRTGADYDKRRISVQSITLGTLFQEREDIGKEDVPYALGDYTTEPDANNLCFAGGAAGTPALSAAEIDLPETMTTDSMGNPVTLPAVHLRQTWENISVYVTAAVPGTQMIGKMTYEDLIEGCKASYNVVALFPAVACNKLDAEGKPTDQPDDAACDPRANPAEGRNFGSGINPDFKVKCDPKFLYCVLDEAPLPAAGP